MKVDFVGMLLNLASFALMGYFFFQAGRACEMIAQAKEELKELREQEKDMYLEENKND